ncbi:MAG: ChaN family lipoprotein [Desulfurococcales archaeon]|nr:ChaN family lipoprotein [Desulfurococcales archaeon]
MGRLYSVRTGEHVNLDEVVSRIRIPHIVFFGETHENPSVIDWELRVLQALYTLASKSNAEFIVGMEHFNIEQQDEIDAYIKGEISWRDLVDIYTGGPEGFNLNYYKPVLDFARVHSIETVGLMPPRTDAKIIARKGLDQSILAKYGLYPDDVSRYPLEYRERLMDLFPREGPMARIDKEKLVLAQSFKDQVMAKRIVEKLGWRTLFYAIMGSGHCEHAGSVPDRVRALSKIDSSITVITVRLKNLEENDKDVRDRLAGNKYIIADFMLII